jgi:hypothetical protein
MTSIPWHELAGFVVLWIAGAACVAIGRAYERSRIIQTLVGLADEHRSQVERLPR